MSGKNVERSNFMSKKACLLTRDDVPQYIREIAQRLCPVLMEFEDEDGNWWGYTFRLDARWKCGYESQLKNDCEKLLKWCESWHAHVKLINYMWWYNEVSTSNEHDFEGTSWHRRKALRKGWRNHAYLVISDPVAHRFEKDGFYHNEKRSVSSQPVSILIP